MENKRICAWVNHEQLYIDYHNNEWGRPVYDDQKLFEFLILDTFQAGLSWITILKKRENFRKAFDDFDASKIAEYGEEKVEELMQNAGIIRNRLKINAAISNAKLYLDIAKNEGGFSKYIWSFVGGSPIVNHYQYEDIPATSAESDAMSKALKKRGFKFVGSTICYAFMQAAGLINDHSIDCYLHPDQQLA